MSILPVIPTKTKYYGTPTAVEVELVLVVGVVWSKVILKPGVVPR